MANRYDSMFRRRRRERVDLTALGARHLRLLRIYWLDRHRNDETVVNALMEVEARIVVTRATTLPELVIRLRALYSIIVYGDNNVFRAPQKDDDELWLAWGVLKDAERLVKVERRARRNPAAPG